MILTEERRQGIEESIQRKRLEKIKSDRLGEVTKEKAYSEMCMRLNTKEGKLVLIGEMAGKDVRVVTDRDGN